MELDVKLFITSNNQKTGVNDVVVDFKPQV